MKVMLKACGYRFHVGEIEHLRVQLEQIVQIVLMIFAEHFVGNHQVLVDELVMEVFDGFE